MLHSFKKWWRFSSLRFYILNARWNYGFWLFSEKIYTNITKMIDDDKYDYDYTFSVIRKKKVISSKRFIGYMYKGMIYLDNPGLQNIDEETWQRWKQKGLIR